MMNGFNIANPDELLAMMLHFGCEGLYDIFKSLSEQEKARIIETKENPSEDIFMQSWVTLIQTTFL